MKIGPGFWRFATRVVATIGAVALLAVGGAAVAFPAVAATACPACYGFERIGSGLFVERTMADERRAHTSHVIEQARDQVGAFYGGLTGSPRILVCATEDCYRRIGGGRSRGMAVLDFALLLSPRGIDRTIASHELSHVELHRRLGWVKTIRQAIPQWFDEGVAVIVSNDPRYLAAPDAVDRCLVVPDDDLPRTRIAWIHGASTDELYAKAACRVTRWMARRGNPRAVVRLIDEVAHGADFDSAFR